MKSTTLTERALQKNTWELARRGDLTIAQAPTLAGLTNLTHAFTTRLGGASAPPRHSFNLERGLRDEAIKADAVKNRQALCRELNLDWTKLMVPGQTHTTNIYFLDAANVPEKTIDDLDAVATAEPAHPVLLLFADCTPILIYDKSKNIVCLVHAGWRGTAGSITAKSVKSLVERFGSNPRDMLAAIGPAIGPCCYETGEDVAARLSSSVLGAQSLIAVKNNKPYPDLQAINALQLLNSGISEVDTVNWCTSCNQDIFYSHRGAGGTTGRHGLIACINS